MSEHTLLPIGSVAAATGVAVSTLRYYDDIGLITTAGRVGGKRRFGIDTPGRVNFVRRAQRAGFSLDEIGSLLDEETADWADIVVNRLHALRSQRDELDTMISLLEDVQSCGCSSVASCPRTTEPC